MPLALALYAGHAGSLATSKGEVRTAIAKSPVAGRAHVAADGLTGDEQVSPGHGGPDRALCVYPREHYAYWAARAEPGFGENITSSGVLERDVRIGDVWRIGGALVQVSQPRSPCFKVAARLGIPDLVLRAKTAPRLAGPLELRHRGGARTAGQRCTAPVLRWACVVDGDIRRQRCTRR